MRTVYEIIEYTSNRYILSKAVMKRARQINFLGDDELKAFDGKVVSLALKQVLENDIKFSSTAPDEEKNR